MGLAAWGSGKQQLHVGRIGGERWTLEATTDNQYICRTTAFEWDDAKAAANWRDHGVSFHDAIKAFRDRFAVERFDDREDYGEERINLLGMCEGVCEGVVLHVTYTERGERIRIISARRGERHEQDDYYRENAR